MDKIIQSPPSARVLLAAVHISLAKFSFTIAHSSQISNDSASERPASSVAEDVSTVEPFENVIFVLLLSGREPLGP